MKSCKFHIKWKALFIQGFDNGDCYDDIGCFKTRYSKEKGYDLRPNALDEVTPTICLYTYTYSNVQACQVVEKDTIGTSLLELSNGSNYWITHGYIENGQRPWIKVYCLQTEAISC